MKRRETAGTARLPNCSQLPSGARISESDSLDHNCIRGFEWGTINHDCDLNYRPSTHGCRTNAWACNSMDKDFRRLALDSTGGKLREVETESGVRSRNVHFDQQLGKLSAMHVSIGTASLNVRPRHADFNHIQRRNCKNLQLIFLNPIHLSHSFTRQGFYKPLETFPVVAEHVDCKTEWSSILGPNFPDMITELSH